MDLECGMDRIGGQLAALEGQKEARRKNRIQKGKSITDQDKPVGRAIAGPLGVIAGDAVVIHLAPRGQVVPDPEVFFNFPAEDGIQIV